MKVRVLAFAALRDRLGFSERELELAPGASVAAAAEALFLGPPPRGVAFAVNREYAAPEARLEEGDELALLPPVSGGSEAADEPPLAVQAGAIDVARLLARTVDRRAGAVLLFLGTARELEGERLVALEYEAYPEMAERYFAGLARELRERHGARRVGIVHRTGRLAPGEASIAIALSTPHRAVGFAALRHAIEDIKEKAPVWKREVTEARARWVAVEKMEGG